MHSDEMFVIYVPGDNIIEINMSGILWMKVCTVILY